MTATNLLRDLIRIPSVNPDGDPGTTLTGEKDCAHFVAEFLRSSGAETDCGRRSAGTVQMLSARFPSESEGEAAPALCATYRYGERCGHGHRSLLRRAARRQNLGRGASDTKGSMAAMLVALHECRDILPPLSHEIWFAGFMGEEAGQQGVEGARRQGEI